MAKQTKNKKIPKKAQSFEDAQKSSKKMLCTYCGSSINIEKEHVIAGSKGGKRKVPACLACNRSKSDKQLMVWLRGLKKSKEPKDKYRWNKIKNYNKDKSHDIAVKVNKIANEK